MDDRTFVSLSLVFAFVGIHAAAMAIRRADCENEPFIVWLANEAQVNCYQRRLGALLALWGRLVPDAARDSLMDAYAAVNDALIHAGQRLALSQGERAAARLAADAQAAARACMEAM